MIITTGIQNGPVVSRLEIRTFLQDKDVVNLYLLAIDQMQKIDQSDYTSWFQLGAIHGRPYVPYDGVGEKGNFGGYCTHSSVLFPTWHRPYIALFEQSISKHVHEIAQEYKNPKDKARYTEAADRFRIPYWDWASEPTLPDLIAKQETVSVHLPDGTQKQIKNPLFAYKFNPVYSDFGDGLPDEKTWESWQETMRYPTRTDNRGKSDPITMQATLANNRITLRDRTYNVLTQTRDYFAFSHDAFNGDDQDPLWYDSLEAIHGTIHGLAGRNGHMGVVDYAAFDPIFWMHHANVDRLFAIWQGLNPDQFVPPWKSEAGTFTRKPGEIENAQSPLTPFRRTETTFWDSDAIRDPHVFNYTYPELAKWNSLSKKEKSIQLHNEVNRIYGKTAPVAQIVPSIFEGLLTLPKESVKVATDAAAATTGAVVGGVLGGASSFLGDLSGQSPQSASDGGSTAQPGSGGKKQYNEYIANIVVEKYAVKTTFFVHIFLGDFNDDSNQWGVDKNLVGSHAVFANNATYTGCERCRSAYEARKLVTGTIPLTGALGERFEGVSSLEPETVLPYLQKNLHWRVQRHDGTFIDSKDVPGLKISVGHCACGAPGSPEAFGRWGSISIDPLVTSGRAGGA